MFESQNRHFWDIKWASLKMLENSDRREIEEIVSEDIYSNNFKLLDIFNKMIENKKNYQTSGIGIFYSVSHALCQSTLAAEKMVKYINRPPQTGEKCHLCGEFEILHDKPYNGSISAKGYKTNTDRFWKAGSRQALFRNEKIHCHTHF